MMDVGLLLGPRNEKVMEPCHVTGMFQTYMLSKDYVEFNNYWYIDYANTIIHLDLQFSETSEISYNVSF
jgi:hypothetical protein